MVDLDYYPSLWGDMYYQTTTPKHFSNTGNPHNMRMHNQPMTHHVIILGEGLL